MTSSDTRSGTLLILGVGKLGGALLDSLTLRYPNHHYVIASRSFERAELRANLARYICDQWGMHPRVTPVAIDLMAPGYLGEAIDRYKPDVLFNATTPFAWWKIDSLPGEFAQMAHDAGPGTWAALDVLLPMRIMEARLAAGDRSVFINGCYPDMVNPFLAGSLGSPVAGIGNIANTVPGLRLAFSRALEIAPEQIQIHFVGHHFTSLNATTNASSLGAPYRLAVTAGELAEPLTYDETSDYPFEILSKLAKRTRGLEGQGVTVSSAAIVTATFLNKERGRHHVPGALGLPGGYPVQIDSDGAMTLDLPIGTSREAAIAVMEAAQRFDGIGAVEAGLVVPTDRAREALRSITGVDVEEVSIDDVNDLAAEILSQLDTRHSLGLLSR